MKIVKRTCPVCRQLVEMEVLSGPDGYKGVVISLRPLRHVGPNGRKKCFRRLYIIPDSG